MRGVSLNKCFIVADEMENTIPRQMKLCLTRIGKGSKIVITGDLGQTDRGDRNNNGLADAIRRLDGLPDVKIITFDKTCVVRDPIVAAIEEKYSDVN